MTRARKRLLLALGVVVVVVAAGVSAIGYWWYRPDPLPDCTGAEFFHTRDLGSPHFTGIPFALALAAMHRYPHELGANAEEFCEKFGVLRDPAKADGLPVGFVLTRDRRTDTDFLMTNCSLCHVGEIGGKLVPGLGNRTLRMNALNHAIHRVAAEPAFTEENMLPAAEEEAVKRGLAWGWRARAATRTAIEKLRAMAAREGAKPGRGLLGIDGGPGRNTPIEFAKTNLHVTVSAPIGYVKYPTLWMYRYRASFGYDGSLVGDVALGLSGVEFNKGMPAEDILRYPARWQRLYDHIATLEPPPYPGPIDRPRAAQGAALYAAHCAACHGTFRPDGGLSYLESVIPVETVGTDPDRMRSVTAELTGARDRTKLGAKMRLIETGGYVPPPLTRIWCRAPYLHNGAVPTLADMLRPEGERPVRFFVGGGTDYDLDRLGLKYDEEPTAEGRRAGRRAALRQSPFDTSDPGNGNRGHRFGTELPAADKRALLEYLKTL
jgi:mono/diheme cytochrome c family protein